MHKWVLGSDWTVEAELVTSRELVGRLAADTAGRVAACIIVAGLVGYAASFSLAVAWASLIFVNEFTEIRIARNIKNISPSAGRWLTPYFAHLGLGSSLWTAMCLMLWTTGDVVNMLMAGAILLGILIHVSLFYNESRLQTLVTGLPPIIGAVTMIAWSTFSPELRGEDKIVAIVALGTLVGYLSAGAYRSLMTRETLRALVVKTTRLAAEDPLTGLQNRRAFVDLVTSQTQGGLSPILAFIDLDRFKPLNDQYGHSVGDEVLKEISRRLVQPGVIASARLGGDEFAVLIAPSEVAGDDQRTIQSLHQRLTAPIDSEAGLVSVGASIGWVGPGKVGLTVSELFHSADVAMRRAKVDRLGFVEFDTIVDSAALASSAIEIALRQAVPDGKIRAALQPIISASDGKIVTMELLARWPGSGFPRDPAPNEFIPIAERIGLLNDMLWSMLNQALPTVAASNWSLAINVSPSQLTSRLFLARLSAVIARHRIPPQRIELEVTEQVAFRNVVENCEVLDEARKLGFRIVLDDFGAGYSSLAILDRLPLDKIKLDQAFVGDLRDRAVTQKIMRATVALAHELGMVCTVEGIESAETAALVASFGCDQMQGYLIGMPELVEPVACRLQRA